MQCFSCLKTMDIKGMTLIEVVIIVAIIATLAGIAAVPYRGYMEKARMVKIIQEIRHIERNLELYKEFNNEYPASLDMLGVVPLDPWDIPYQYTRVAGAKVGELRKDHNLVPVNTDYDLYSMGADGKSKPPFTAKPSHDDIVRANNGEFIGLVSDY